MMSRLYQLETGNRKPLPYLNLHYKHLYDIIILTFIKCPEVYMQGIALIITFVIAIALMIFAISKLKIHPFLSIMGVSLLLALAAGIPLVKIPGTIGAGFSGTFTSIGIVIILGALIGTILEKTGAALKLSGLSRL